MGFVVRINKLTPKKFSYSPELAILLDKKLLNVETDFSPFLIKNRQLVFSTILLVCS